MLISKSCSNSSLCSDSSNINITNKTDLIATTECCYTSLCNKSNNAQSLKAIEKSILFIFILLLLR